MKKAKRRKRKIGGKKALYGRAKRTYAKLRVNPPVNESSYSHSAIIEGRKAGRIASRAVENDFVDYGVARGDQDEEEVDAG